MVVTTQQTAKRWKALRVAAFAMGVAGAAVFLIAFWPVRNRADTFTVLAADWRSWAGLTLLLAGLGLDLYARFMAWWHHA